MEKFKGKKTAVIGLGIEGKDAINFLISAGAIVTLFDKKSENELDFSGIDKEKIKIISGKDYLENGIKGYDFIIRSPGVYPYLKEIKNAQEKGAVLTSAIKIFFDECPGEIIGVTGTKGKGTTSTLIYEILKAGGKDVFLTGNIGKPSLELLPKLSKDSWVVMELSSFQLIDLDKSPHIAIVLNVTDDHMDWHRDHEEYVNAKKNIVRHQSPSDYSLLNEEYETPKSFSDATAGKVVFFSKKILDEKFKEKLLLRGEHNLENIAAAVETAKVVGVDEKTILGVLRNFKGLEHRLELVDEIDGVKYYNDSFATGPQPTIAAIKSFTEPETLILGGSDKGLDYKELASVINSRKNIKNIILIGDTRTKIMDTLKGVTLQGEIVDLKYSSMFDIVNMAAKLSKNGDVVILSPASASFDMFKNYKDRGNQFKDSVLSLKTR